MAWKRITDEDIRVLFRNDGEDKSGICSEDEVYISSDRANDILLSHPESDCDSSNDKGDADSNHSSSDNRNIYTLKSCNGTEALSLIHFTAAQGRASLRNIKSEKNKSIKHIIRMSCIIFECFPFFFRMAFSKQYVNGLSKKVVKFGRSVEKMFQLSKCKI